MSPWVPKQAPQVVLKLPVAVLLAFFWVASFPKFFPRLEGRLGKNLVQFVFWDPRGGAGQVWGSNWETTF